MVEKVQAECAGVGPEWQSKVEGWWEQAGIVSSARKQVTAASHASELGVFFAGDAKLMGCSPERMTKVLKATLWLISKSSVKVRELQVLMGRWVFLLQFRRPAMSHFEEVWDFISKDRFSTRTLQLVKEELLSACCSVCLLHTFLGATFDPLTTCSDASGRGGAVAMSTELSPCGNSFLFTQEKKNKATRVPVVCLSLFNAIGGAYRSYDVAGAELAGGISVDSR